MQCSTAVKTPSDLAELESFLCLSAESGEDLVASQCVLDKYNLSSDYTCKSFFSVFIR